MSPPQDFTTPQKRQEIVAASAPLEVGTYPSLQLQRPEAAEGITAAPVGLTPAFIQLPEHELWKELLENRGRCVRPKSYL